MRELSGLVSSAGSVLEEVLNNFGKKFAAYLNLHLFSTFIDWINHFPGGHSGNRRAVQICE